MLTSLLPAPVQPMSEEEQQISTETQRIHADLMNLARLVVAYRRSRGKKTNMVEYFDTLLRPLVTRDYAAEKALEDKRGKRA